jgi:hypothetical protein
VLIDDTLKIEAMIELIAVKGMTIGGAASAVANMQGNFDLHDDPEPQRLARKCRQKYGRNVIRVFRDPAGSDWYTECHETNEYFLKSRGLLDLAQPPAGWKAGSVIKTHQKRVLMQFPSLSELPAAEGL